MVKKLQSRYIIRSLMRISRVQALLFFALSVAISLSANSIYAQNDQSLELGATSATDADPDNDGPKTTITIPLLHNINNPADNTFTNYYPFTTATITVGFFQIADVNQDTGADVSPVLLGFNYNPGGATISGVVNGTGTDVVVPFEDLDESIDDPDNEYSQAELQEFYSAIESTIGSGIDFEDNYGVFIAAGFEGLRGQTFGGSRYHVADLTISFNRPINNPILHFFGLGGFWEYFATGGVFFINSASLEFDLTSSTSNNGVTLSVLSANPNNGGTGLGVVGVGGNSIINTWNIPDVIDTEFSVDDDSGVANGSVLVEGEGVTSLTFEMHVRAITNVAAAQAVFDGICGFDPINDDPADRLCIIGNEEFGWGGDATDPVTGIAIPEYNIAQDIFVLSISTRVDTDDTQLTQGDSYRMLSSPVANTSYDDLIGHLWTQGGSPANGYDTEFGDPNVFRWPLGLSAANSWEDNFDLGTAIPPGHGFLMTVFEDDEFGVSGSFPKTLSVTGSEPAPPIVVNDGGGDNGGWLLLGNPFKEPIDLSVLFASRITSNLNQVVYVWDRGIGAVDDPTREPGWRWAISDPGVSSTPENPVLGSMGQTVIMPFQGFFMERNSASGNAIVTFDDNNGLTRDALTTTTTGTFFRKEADVENLVVLNLSGESLHNSLWLRFSENGSNERLRNDALELASYNEHYAHFATKKSDGALLTMAQLPLPTKEFSLPVTVETTRPGTYTISAEQLNLSFDLDLYFIDTQENQSIQIDQNFSYTFTINQAAKANVNPVTTFRQGPQKAVAEFADRFLITTQPRETQSNVPDQFALKQNYPNPFNPTTQITYQLPQQSDVRLTVFDMVGRQVATLVNGPVQAGTHTVNFDASNLSSGVYIYRLTAGNTVLTRKLTLLK